MTLTVGSLCTGTAALESALAQVLDAVPLWFADPDPGAAALLEHHYPDTPNLGDLTKVDWRAIRRPDIIAAGFPCQDISAAGLQAGMLVGNRSGLWFWIVRAIAELRPQLVVIENVRALLTARGAPPTPELIAAWADLERYARVLTLIEAKLNRAMKRAQRDRIQRLTADRVRIMGRHRRAVGAVKRADARIVRAIGTVLGDLADLGFDAEWCVLPASGVGAPHQRQRVFIVAVAADARRVGVLRLGPAEPRRRGGAAADPAREGLEGLARGGRPAAGVRRRPPEAAGPAGPTVADPEGDGRGEGWPEPSPGRPAGTVGDSGGTAPDTDGGGREQHPELDGEPVEPELETPLGDDLVGCVLDWAGAAVAHPDDVLLAAQPRGVAGRSASGERPDQGADRRPGDRDERIDWAAYAPAIERWERVLGRPAPAPTVLGARGARRLSPRFVEWMMGLPEGWVTAVPGITRNQALKMLGNGIVAQQAAAAVAHLLPLLLDELVAA